MKKLITSVLLVTFILLSANLSLADIQGNWKASSEDGVKYWKISKDALVMSADIVKNENIISVSNNEKIPDSDWTIDMWLYTPAENAIPALSLEFGKDRVDSDFTTIQIYMEMNRCKLYAQNYFVPSPGSRGMNSISAENAAGGGHICWIRIINHKEAMQLHIFTNGQAVEPLNYKKLPSVPLTLSINKPNTCYNVNLKIIDFKIQNIACPEPKPLGPAFDGWSVKLDYSQLRQKDFPAFIDNQINEASYNITKSYFLTSKVLWEYANNSKISDATWSKVSDFCEALIGVDHRPLAVILPIAVKCASVKQKQEAKKLIDKMFMIPANKWREMQCTYDTFLKFLMIDLYNSDITGSNIYPYGAVDTWTRWMQKNNPDYAIFPIAYALGNAEMDPRASAWNLPLFASINQRYYDQFMDLLLNDYPKKDFHGSKIEPDMTLAFGAYRLADAKNPDAINLWSKISNLSLKAETAVYMVKVNPDIKKSLNVLSEMEVLLNNQIKEWTPTSKGARLIDLKLGLMDFYLLTGMKDKAENTINEIDLLLQKEEKPKFTDYMTFYRQKKQMDVKKANEMWPLLVEKAKELDAAHENNDRYTNYISPINLLIQELISQDKLDEGLNMVNMFNPEIREMNISMCMEMIISKITPIDVERAIVLAKKIPMENPRYNRLGRIAFYIAKTNPKRAIEMVEEIPVDNMWKTTSIMRLCQVIPLTNDSKLMEIISNSIKSRYKQDYPDSAASGISSDSDNIKDFVALDFQTLLNLKPAFNNCPTSFAQVLLFNIGEHAGLANDPDWNYYCRKGSDISAIVPYGNDKLEIAVKNSERLKKLPY